MGMTWSGYAAIVFTAIPPQMLLSRSESGGSARLIFATFTVSIAGFLVMGVGAALAADAAMPGVGGDYSIVANVPYTSFVTVLALVAGVPLTAFMRTHILHIAIWLTMAAGVYGALIPNLVLALQNR